MIIQDMHAPVRTTEKPDKRPGEALTALKEELLSKAELSIWLDTYNDIFSDFDPRPFSERALSDDFINEVKKMARENSTGPVVLTLLMPANLRQHATEETIIKSLHAHFRLFARQQQQEMKKLKRKGALLTLAGVFILALVAYVVQASIPVFFSNLLPVTMEPFGLFLVWTGLEILFYEVPKKKPGFEFNHQMAHAEIKFLSI